MVVECTDVRLRIGGTTFRKDNPFGKQTFMKYWKINLAESKKIYEVNVKKYLNE